MKKIQVKIFFILKTTSTYSSYVADVLCHCSRFRFLCLNSCRCHCVAVDHRATDCLSQAIPLSRLIYDARKNCVDCPHSLNQIRCAGDGNGVVVSDVNYEIDQIHETIHFRCPMFDDFDDVV